MSKQPDILTPPWKESKHNQNKVNSFFLFLKMEGNVFALYRLFDLLSFFVSLSVSLITSTFIQTPAVFFLSLPAARWAPAAHPWTATSSHWRSVWCARTWRETLCSGPADTSPPALSARPESRSVSSARIRSSREPRYRNLLIAARNTMKSGETSFTALFVIYFCLSADRRVRCVFWQKGRRVVPALWSHVRLWE